MHFNPRSPWGERPLRVGICWCVVGFQSTLPVGGATVSACMYGYKRNISIHAPRGGSDHILHGTLIGRINFNPRSPWGERLVVERAAPSEGKFQSTLPVGGATTLLGRLRPSHQDFNPRSPWGERRSGARVSVTNQVFQSTLPVGGATMGGKCSEYQCRISIHAPRGGSDSSASGGGARNDDFNPRSPWGERPIPLVGVGNFVVFQSTLPVGGAT